MDGPRTLQGRLLFQVKAGFLGHQQESFRSLPPFQHSVLTVSPSRRTKQPRLSQCFSEGVLLAFRLDGSLGRAVPYTIDRLASQAPACSMPAVASSRCDNRNAPLPTSPSLPPSGNGSCPGESQLCKGMWRDSGILRSLTQSSTYHTEASCPVEETLELSQGKHHRSL